MIHQPLVDCVVFLNYPGEAKYKNDQSSWFHLLYEEKLGARSFDTQNVASKAYQTNYNQVEPL